MRIVEISLERRSVTSDRARRATQTAAKREEGLQRRRDGWATTVPECREARLQQRWDRQRDRLADETPERREARLLQYRESCRSVKIKKLLFVHRHHSVHSKIVNFHTHLANLEVSRSTTCYEVFPGV